MTKRAALLLVLVPSCTLVLDPGRHQGGGGSDVGVDAPAPDVPGLDAPELDAPTERDAGTPDAGPPECTTGADCDFASQCVSGRCVLCVGTPTIVDVDSDPALFVGDLDLIGAFGSATPELALSWRGDGTRSYLHRTPISAPAAPTTRSSVTDALTLGFVTGITEVIDIALGAGRYEDGERRIDVAMVGRNTAGTFLTAAEYVPGSPSITSSTFPDAERFTLPDELFGRIALEDVGVVSRRLMGGSHRVDVLDTAYLNPQRTATFGVPTAAFTTVESAGGVVMMAEATGPLISTWSTGMGFDTVDSSGRTGEPSWTQVAARSFMVAYPAGREIVMRQLDCIGTCFPSASVRVDFATGADEVAWVRVASLGTSFALLSAERTGTRWRVVVRVLRSDFRPLTAPGGLSSAWVLAESDAATYPVGRLVVGANEGGVLHVAAAWIEQPTAGARVLRLTSEPVACP